MSPHVFVSYSRSDSEYVGSLVAFLTEHGVPVWVDTNLDFGDRWNAVIRQQVEQCAVVVPVMTPAAEASTWVDREIRFAESLGKPIVPLLLAGQPFFGLFNVQYGDVRDGRLPSMEFVGRLRRAIGGGVALEPLPDADADLGPRFSWAERLARTVTSPAMLAELLVDLANAVWERDRSQADRLITEARKLVDSPTDPVGTWRTHLMLAYVAVRSRPYEAPRLLADAERLARSGPGDHAGELLGLARMSVPYEPDRAERIALEVALEIENPYRFSLRIMFGDLVAAMAGENPERAEGIARTGQGPRATTVALRALAKAVVRTDPRRAERIVHSLPGEDLSTKADALAELAAMTAVNDPRRSDRLITEAVAVARSITEVCDVAYSLAQVATAMAPKDLDQAEVVAVEAARMLSALPEQSRTYFASSRVCDTLTSLATAAGADPEQAERLVRAIPDVLNQRQAIAKVTAPLWTRDRRRAQRLVDELERQAMSEADGPSRAIFLSYTLAALGPDNLERAGRLADESERLAYEGGADESTVLGVLAESVVATDPDRAERVALAIADQEKRDWALRGLARADGMAPAQAERIARAISDRTKQVDTLGFLAERAIAREPEEAERIARTLADAEARDHLLARLARAAMK